MNAKFVGITFLVLCPVLLFADQLVLKEGKRITGKITHEDEQEYTIKISRTMVLRVEKSKVAEVIREQPEPTPTIPSYTPRPVVTSSATVVPPPAIVKNLKTDSRKSERKVKGISIIENIVYETQPATSAHDVRESAKAKKQDLADVSWTAEWRAGERAVEMGKHKWKSGVIVATITVTVPVWNPAEKPASAETDDWNALVGEITPRSEARIRLYSQSLDNIAESLGQYFADSAEMLVSESKTMFNQMKQQAENRQQGFLRRKKNPLTTK